MRIKRKYLICKDSIKLAKQLDLALKEIDIKDKAIETAKSIKTEAQGLNQFKNAL